MRGQRTAGFLISARLWWIIYYTQPLQLLPQPGCRVGFYDFRQMAAQDGAGEETSAECGPTCTMPTLDCTASWISLLQRLTISAFHCRTCPALTSTAEATTGACREEGTGSK